MDLIEPFLSGGVWPCDWGDFAARWLEAAETRPALILRYEDLVQGPRQALEQVLAFLDVDIPPARLQAAVSMAEPAVYAQISRSRVASRSREGARRLPPDLYARFPARWPRLCGRFGYR